MSNAGGLGSLGCALLSPQGIRRELETIRAQTDKLEAVVDHTSDISETHARHRRDAVVPAFLVIVLGPLLILVFSLELGWLPPALWSGPSTWILPALTLGATYAAYISRLTRAGLLEVVRQDYMRTARAKGLPEWLVVMRHGLRGGDDLEGGRGADGLQQGVAGARRARELRASSRA